MAIAAALALLGVCGAIAACSQQEGDNATPTLPPAPALVVDASVAEPDATIAPDAGEPGPDAAMLASFDAGLRFFDAGDGAVGSCAASAEGLWFEIGDDPFLDCNTTAICRNGTLVIESTPADGNGCPTPTLAESPACPTSSIAAAAEDAGSCDEGQQCAYPDRYCECVRTAGATIQYACAEPGGTCPLARPHLGTTCDGDAGSDSFCSYVFCASPHYGNAEKCTNGSWQPANVADICGP